MENFANKLNWTPPDNWQIIKTIDMHTGGEPLRIPISGLPKISGNTVLEKRRYFKKHFDHIRTGLMFEPRGHADMYGAIISTPSTPDADFDVFFIHNEGYSTMCGHAIIALSKFAVETKLVSKRNKIVINVPAGKVEAEVRIENDIVMESSFLNVPSFPYLLGQQIELLEFGPINVDIAFGGAFYAFVNASQIYLELNASNYNRIIDLGRKIKKSVIEKIEILHPEEEDLSFLYGTIFIDKPNHQDHHSRNVCVFAEGEVDRSATGTGVSARAAIHFAKGDIKVDQPIVIESILDSTMKVEVVKKFDYYGYQAVIPKVSGSAFFTGESRFYYNPSDPYKHGFIFR